MENPTEPIVRRRDLRKAEEAERKNSRKAPRTFSSLTTPVKSIAGKTKTMARTPLAADVVGSENIAFRGSNGKALRQIRRRRNIAVTAVTSVSVAGTALAAVLLSGAAGTANSQVIAESSNVSAAVSAESISGGAARDDDNVKSGQGQSISGGVSAAQNPDAKAASRTVTRTVLPGCTGEVPQGEVSNGQVPDDYLCSVGIGDHKLRQDAAIAFAEMNAAYKAETGKDMALTDTYRSLESQVSVAARKPGLAAAAGTSMHGYGIAIDFGDGAPQASGELYNWLVEHGGEYGWENPDWAKSSKYEPWHWEYVPARQQIKGH